MGLLSSRTQVIPVKESALTSTPPLLVTEQQVYQRRNSSSCLAEVEEGDLILPREETVSELEATCNIPPVSPLTCSRPPSP